MGKAEDFQQRSKKRLAFSAGVTKESEMMEKIAGLSDIWPKKRILLPVLLPSFVLSLSRLLCSAEADFGQTDFGQP